MASPSVSFRISRSTEDLAETIHALSHRLVKLEQRLASFELQVSNLDKAAPEELASLDHVSRLLQDCRDLLDSDPLASGDAAERSNEQPPMAPESAAWSEDNDDENDIATAA
jgi:uncharacterized membrane protein YccC